jgi:hypothetical protein
MTRMKTCRSWQADENYTRFGSFTDSRNSDAASRYEEDDSHLYRTRYTCPNQLFHPSQSHFIQGNKVFVVLSH